MEAKCSLSSKNKSEAQRGETKCASLRAHRIVQRSDTVLCFILEEPCTPPNRGFAVCRRSQQGSVCVEGEDRKRTRKRVLENNKCEI